MASKSKQTKVGSLEVKTSKAGLKYLSGTILGTDYLAFKAKDEYLKEHPKAPNVSGFIDIDYQEGEKKEYTLALWSRSSKDGKTKYLSGVAGGVKIVAFFDAKKGLYNVFKEKELPKADITDEELSF